MASVVVDTDVASFCFKRDTRAERYDIHLSGRTLILSFMTLAELDFWALKRRWGQARKDKLETYLHRFVIYPYNRILCQKWAEVMRTAERRGEPVQSADAWIAATALVAGVPLVTHNRADFAVVPGLTVLSETAP